jgi:hypothetical protein
MEFNSAFKGLMLLEYLIMDNESYVQKKYVRMENIWFYYHDLNGLYSSW